MPELKGDKGWINSAPLTTKSLRGKVVVVDIWTYSCINSLRQLPYLQSWAAKYKNQGLVVIGVHAPEFGFEKVPANVDSAVRELNVTYPVVIDSDHNIW
ncbi:MAG TPA: redoxin domain-containing protein, partial [Gemmatimonadaceae bacterium]|nr:redoxin domain-containing protein [Gemmatimonadaceae bacterium]